MTRRAFPSAGLSVTHVVAGLHPSSGGPSRMVVQLTDALANQPEVVTLLSQSLAGEPAVPSKVAAVDRRLGVARSSPTLRLALPIRRELGWVFWSNRPAVVHSHGLWVPAGHSARPCSSRRRETSYVVSGQLIETGRVGGAAICSSRCIYG